MMKYSVSMLLLTLILIPNLAFAERVAIITGQVTCTGNVGEPAGKVRVIGGSAQAGPSMDAPFGGSYTLTVPIKEDGGTLHLKTVGEGCGLYDVDQTNETTILTISAGGEDWGDNRDLRLIPTTLRGPGGMAALDAPDGGDLNA